MWSPPSYILKNPSLLHHLWEHRRTVKQIFYLWCNSEHSTCAEHLHFFWKFSEALKQTAGLGCVSVPTLLHSGTWSSGASRPSAGIFMCHLQLFLAQLKHVMQHLHLLQSAVASCRLLTLIFLYHWLSLLSSLLLLHDLAQSHPSMQQNIFPAAACPHTDRYILHLTFREKEWYSVLWKFVGVLWPKKGKKEEIICYSLSPSGGQE